MRRFVFYIILTIMWSGCACGSKVTITPPRVPEGGRAVAVSVALADGKRVIVASESGGLFRSLDGGKSFLHLNAFPTFKPVDVVIGSPDKNIILATARDDFRTQSGAGIWRSANGGDSWQRPGGWPPPQTNGCNRPVARGISHPALSRTWAVATDCGIAISSDNGASFVTSALDPARPLARGVFMFSARSGVAADDSSLWVLNGSTWQRAAGGPTTGGSFGTHNFAAPWWTGSPIVYHSGRDRGLYFSTDGGANWTQMETPPLPDPNREHFIRAGRGLDGNGTHVDIYFGDGLDVWRQAVTTAVPATTAGAWNKLKSDHSDPADVAFTPGETEPFMLATDGGVHLTSDSGRTWKFTGGGFGGYAALQIGEITGRSVGGQSPHLDLFYATQDNSIKASADGGQTWQHGLGGEGAILRAGAVDPVQIDQPVTGKLCGNCLIFEATPHLDGNPNFTLFRNAPNGDPASRAFFPFQIVNSAYVQAVTDSGPPQKFDFFLTLDRGNGWRPAFSVTEQPFGIVQFGGSLANPTAYASVQSPGGVGLVRASNVATSASVRRADSTGSGFRSLGVLRTGQGMYAVFGVDPNNADHLLAADVGRDSMQASSDGGKVWYSVPALTAAVTDSGRFIFDQPDGQFPNRQSLASTIAWDPTNSCHILVGTMQNGIIRSADGGTTWQRVEGSTAATYITSFYFPPTGDIWMSTHGRSLWTVRVDRAKPKGGRCSFPPPPPTTPSPQPKPPVAWPVLTRRAQPFTGLRDSLMCARCTLLATRYGAITDVQLRGDTVVRVLIDHGALAERDATGKEVAQSVPNDYADQPSDRLQKLFGADLAGRDVRALVLLDRRIVAYVLAGDELSQPPTPTPRLYIESTGSSHIPDVVESGDSVVVRGSGFVPGLKTAGVDLVADGDTAARAVEVKKDGTFSVRLAVRRGRGDLQVTAVQRTGLRLTIAAGHIQVVGRERE